MKLSCDREKLLHAFQMAASVAPGPRAPSRSCRTSSSKLTAGPDRPSWAPTWRWASASRCRASRSRSPAACSCRSTASARSSAKAPTRSCALESDGAQDLRPRRARASSSCPRRIRTSFPEVAVFEEEKYHELPARFFRELVRRTVFATDNESSRYALGGVLLEMAAEQMTGVATDGRRLARQEGPAKSVGGHELGRPMTIVPTRAMQLLERALADNDERDPARRPRERRPGRRAGRRLLAAGRGPVSPSGATCSRRTRVR